MLRSLRLLPLLALLLPATAHAESATCRDQVHEREWADHVTETGIGCQSAEGFALDYLKYGHRHGHLNLRCNSHSFPNIRCTLSHEGAVVGHVDFVYKLVPAGHNIS
jgi:hypothetical protein